MTPASPSLCFDSGLEIGYQNALARFTQAVTLTAGSHFLLARNGRGKTTLLRTLARSLKPITGSFSISGFIQYLPEDLRFDPEISASLIFRSLITQDRLANALALADRIELDVRKPYGRLSTGNRRKANLIAVEFSTHPNHGNILLLDEPFSGLDAFSREAFETIWQQSAANVLRLVSCHPDYDSMLMPSALIIEGNAITHQTRVEQTWNQLKQLLN